MWMSAKDRLRRGRLSTPVALYLRELAGSAARGTCHRPLLFLVSGDSFGDGISMDAEGLRSVSKVGFVPGERPFYIEFFKLV